MIAASLDFMKNLVLVKLIIGLAVFGSVAGAQRVDELSTYNEPPSRLRGVIEKYREDYGSINRFYTAQTSAKRSARLRQLHADYLAILNRLNFSSLNPDERIDV